MMGAGTRFPSTYNRLGKWYPNISVSFQVTPQELTRDHAEQERHHGDGLVRDSVSLRCLGDMIYQGQKILTRRWKHFPPALPTLLLHGTEDPICSYQATSTLSTLILRLNPIDFSLHYIKPPLELDMVHSDSLKSARRTKSKEQQVTKDLDKGKTVVDLQKGNKSSSPESSVSRVQNEQKQGQQQQKIAGSTPLSPSQPGVSAVAEPEAIHDLAGLRRQQELKLQKAMEKRRQYNLEINVAEEKSATGHEAMLKQSQATTAADTAPAPEKSEPDSDNNKQLSCSSIDTNTDKETSAPLSTFISSFAPGSDASSPGSDADANRPSIRAASEPKQSAETTADAGLRAPVDDEYPGSIDKDTLELVPVPVSVEALVKCASSSSITAIPEVLAEVSQKIAVLQDASNASLGDPVPASNTEVNDSSPTFSDKDERKEENPTTCANECDEQNITVPTAEHAEAQEPVVLGALNMSDESTIIATVAATVVAAQSNE
ncbi:hypothetical protein BGX28_006134 [Mortierella sp. GBA30]|nr:hypothetical protein BGX28_006134 [Mortierella sp. GBA30]